MSPPPGLDREDAAPEDNLPPALRRFIESLAEAQARADYAAARAKRESA